MLIIRNYVLTGLGAMLLATTVAFAGDSPEEVMQRMGKGDPVAGKDKSALCQGCHGENGISPTPETPHLAGQYAGYIQKQIRNFQAGTRKDPVMTDMAATVTEEQDLLDISAYFASQKQMKGYRMKPNEAGRELFEDGNGCANCHGENGKGMSPRNARYPVIGGQHKAYLIKQLNDFKTRARTNDASGMMARVASSLSKEDVEAVVDYISGM